MAATESFSQDAPSQVYPEKEKGERRGGKEPQKGRRRPRKKKRKAGKKRNLYMREKGRGGSHYRKWAPVLVFQSKRCMRLSTFLRGFLRAIVLNLSSCFAMEQ